MWNKKFTKIFIYLITILISRINPEYVVNQDGETCGNSPSDPASKEDCLNYNTEDKACCFATILLHDRTSINKCIEVSRDARFALNFLTIFTFEDKDHTVYEDVTGTFECEQIDKLCGMDSPKETFQCSEHSSTKQSCCYLSTPTYTECVLSDKKYDRETIFEIFPKSIVTCESSILILNYKFLLFPIILFLINFF